MVALKSFFLLFPVPCEVLIPAFPGFRDVAIETCEVVRLRDDVSSSDVGEPSSEGLEQNGFGG